MEMTQEDLKMKLLKELMNFYKKKVKLKVNNFFLCFFSDRRTLNVNERYEIDILFPNLCCTRYTSPPLRSVKQGTLMSQ